MADTKTSEVYADQVEICYELGEDNDLGSVLGQAFGQTLAVGSAMCSSVERRLLPHSREVLHLSARHHLLKRAFIIPVINAHGRSPGVRSTACRQALSAGLLIDRVDLGY